MDKKKLGALVGVVGVAGALTATQLIDLQESSADYVSNDLIKKLEESAETEAAKAVEEQSPDLVEKVYNPATKVEYIVAAPISSETKQEETAEPISQVEEMEEEQPEEELPPVSESVELIVQLEEQQPAVAERAVVEDSEETVEEPVLPEPEEEAVDSEEDPAEIEESEEQPVEVAEVEEEPVEIEEPVVETTTEFYGLVDTEELIVRQGASLESPTLGVLYYDDIVRGERKDNWIKIDFLGHEAFISADLVREESLETIEEMEYQAEQERIAEEEAAREEAERIAAEEAAEAARLEEERKAAEEAAREEAERKAAEEAATTPRSYWVTVDYLYKRVEPDLYSAENGGLTKGQEAYGTVHGDWLKLEDGSGYVALWLLVDEKPDYAVEVVEEPVDVEEPEEIEEPVDVEEPEEEYYSGYTQEVSRVRSGPGLGYQHVDSLPANTFVEGVLVDGWVRFEHNGETVYMSTLCLGDKLEVIEVPVEEPVEEEPEDSYGDEGAISRIIDHAYSLLGSSYEWGAKGPYSFDCSGFVYYLYQNEGIPLNQSSRWQATNGYAVSWDNLQPGDLLFFDTMGGGGISHVGLYVGGGTMIHASDYDTGVTTDSIYSGYWSYNFVTARRIINY